MLPGMSVLKVCLCLKLQEETKSIRIFILSAHSEELDQVHGLQTGADDYIGAL